MVLSPFGGKSIILCRDTYFFGIALRRQSAIVNQNTLIYVLINLRTLQRIRVHQEQRAQQSPAPGRAQP